MAVVNDIPHDQSLILNFFNSEVYFIFNSREEKEIFIKFISLYDSRMRNIESNVIDKIKSVAWKESKSLHRHQMEWVDNTNYFEKKYDMIPIDFGLVRAYCEKLNAFVGMVKDYNSCSCYIERYII